jgi:hypothetical protein
MTLEVFTDAAVGTLWFVTATSSDDSAFPWEVPVVKLTNPLVVFEANACGNALSLA